MTESTNQSQWKDGDWCFYEYKLCQIKVEIGKVREASDGMFTTSGHDLSGQCRPLTLRNANLTQHTQYWSDRVHKDGHSGLNYPDIHAKMVNLWCDACDAKETKEQKRTAEAIGTFVSAVLKTCEESPEIYGVRVLRRMA